MTDLATLTAILYAARWQRRVAGDRGGKASDYCRRLRPMLS